MVEYKDLKINDRILIPKGTPIWSIKLQQTIVLYQNIIARINATTTTQDSIFVIPQIKIMYLDFDYKSINHESKELITPTPSIPEYKDDTTFGELHYVFDSEEYTNNHRFQKLDEILNEKIYLNNE